jgi:WD40 repeat protein
MRSLVSTVLLLAVAGGGRAADAPPAWKEVPANIAFPVGYAGFTPERKMLVLVSGKGESRVGFHDAMTGKELKPALKLPIGRAFGQGFGGQPAFSADYKKLALLLGSFQIGAKQKILIWDVAARKQLAAVAKDFPNLATSPTVNLQPGMAWDPSGQRLLTSSESDRAPGELIVWDGTTGKKLAQLPSFRESVHAVTWSPDGKQVAYAGTKNIKVYEVASKRAVQTIPATTDTYVQTLIFTPDGERLITVHDGAMAAGLDAFMQATAPGVPRPRVPRSAVRVWDLATGKPLVLFLARRQDEGSSLGALSPDGKTFAAQVVKNAAFGEAKPGVLVQPSPSLRLWDVTSGKELAMLEGGKGSPGFTSLAFAPDGRRLVATTAESEIRMWERTDTPGEPPPAGKR